MNIPAVRKKLGTLLRKSGCSKQQTKSVVDALVSFVESCAGNPPQSDHEVVSSLMGLMLPIITNTGLPVLEIAKDMLGCSQAFPESDYGIPAYAQSILSFCEYTFDKLLEGTYPDQASLHTDMVQTIYRLKATYMLASLLICHLPRSHSILPNVELNTFPITPEQSQQIKSGSTTLEQVVQNLKSGEKTQPSSFQLDLSKLNEIYERYKKPSPN